VHTFRRSSPIGAAVALALLCWSSYASPEEVSSIGYATVAEALEALRADPTATVRTERGWTVFERADALEIWSFTPNGQPAHPSAAKRTLYQSENGGWYVVTRMLCQSSKPSCVP
jgi:hypothetical protein